MSNKYLFIGEYIKNEGPGNVNIGLRANFDDTFITIKSKNRYLNKIEDLYKLLFCKVVIISGLSRFGVVLCKMCKHLNKKTIYIAHGCYKIEHKLNEFILDEQIAKMEYDTLYYADLTLAVSKIHKQNLMDQYPFVSKHIDYLYNGVAIPNYNISNIKRIKNSIIAVGGDRKLKNNIKIAEAMKLTNTNNKLGIYGGIYEPDKLPKGDNFEFYGNVDQKELYKQMAASELYILNSLYEPFALSVFDALLCGCSILITKYAGALELLNVTDNDVINNPNDVNEIANKINYLLKHPNNQRIMKDLDLSSLSYKAEVNKLKEKCENLLNK